MLPPPSSDINDNDNSLSIHTFRFCTKPLETTFTTNIQYRQLNFSSTLVKSGFKMAQKSYTLLVALLVTFILLDCFTECGAAKNKGKGKGKERKKGQFREDSPASPDLSNCVFAEEVNFICGSDGVVYANAKNLECGNLLRGTNVKEADRSTCPDFPKTDEQKKKLEEMWKVIIKEFTDMKAGAPKTARKKDHNKGNKTNRNDKKKNDKEDKNKKRKG